MLKRGKIMNKRGQATILILLGIIVVGLIGGVYFTKDYIFKSKLERMSEKSLVVPRQAESVKEYVMSCVRQVSREGVEMVGLRGGYIEVPNDPIPLSVHNKFSNYLEVLPGLRVPYWYYKKANNVDEFQILNLKQISGNIENYINEQLRICVGDFAGFKKEGYNINPGMIKTSVEVQDKKIYFEINFPVHIEIKDFEFDFRNFYYQLDKPLGELYDIARGIYTYENGMNFLEDKTIDIMVGYDEIPLTGENVDCGFTPIWDKLSVVDNFKKFLSYNIPNLKIKGSNYFLDEKLRRYYEVDIGNVKDIDINFIYSERWPFYLDVSPSDGNIMKAESITGGLGGKLRAIVESVICYNYWTFVYDVKYPVLVTLNKDDYIFQFGMMVVIDKNRPRENIIEPLFVDEPDVKYCENEQYNIEVSVFDQDGNAVDDAVVKYKCINHVCDLGETSGNYFIGRVMPCVSGSVLAHKEGYHYGKTQVSTLEDVSVSVSMEKLAELDVKVEVLRAGSGEMKEDENVYISMLNEEDDYSVSLIYPDVKKIKLIPGKYQVDLYMMKESDDGIKIPGREVETCIEVPKKDLTGIFGATEEKCVSTEVPGVELERVIVGSVKFDMFVNRGDLRNKIIFYAPYQGVPRKYEDLYEMSTEVGEGFVYPRFS